jgi:hypothetical protein
LKLGFKHERLLYFDSAESRKEWVERLKRALRVRSVEDLYEVDERHILGKGSFGTVILGRHKVTGEQVAVKMQSKVKMDQEELE